MSAKKKGLSVDEKRKRLLQMFYEKQDFLNLKEVEKYGSKEKGITSMTVKDILQSLVDDSMVDTERIGTSNYYWAFPSKGLQIRKRKIGELSDELHKAKQRRDELEEQQSNANDGREETDERATALAELQQEQSIFEQIQAELQKYKESDPEVLEAKKRDTQTCVDAANRWTDNIFSVRTWIRDKNNMEMSQIDQCFGIPADFDYVELK